MLIFRVLIVAFSNNIFLILTVVVTINMDLLSVLMLLVIYYDNLKSLYSDELDMC